MKVEKQRKILELFEVGRYSCTEQGLVLSGQHILGQRVTSRGYRMVTLSRVPDRLDCLVHQVCFLYFTRGYDETKQINHKDGDKLNNALCNLELVTASENQMHSRLVLGNVREQRGEASSTARLTWEKVRRLREEHAKGITQRALAVKYDVTFQTINLIVLHKTWKEQHAISGN